MQASDSAAGWVERAIPVPHPERPRSGVPIRRFHPDMAPIPILARFARVAPLLGMIQKADHAQQGRLFKFKVKVKVNINTNLNAKTNARSNALDLKHRHPFRSWFARVWRTMIWKGAGKR
ncbi:MAG: hypothetical protein IPL96_10930 [Holophagaceae bacterium]|nr:hypothetical protein [Holophagaceae bacterium]